MHHKRKYHIYAWHTNNISHSLMKNDGDGCAKKFNSGLKEDYSINNFKNL